MEHSESTRRVPDRGHAACTLPATLSLLLAANAAYAEGPDLLEKQWSLSLGTYILDTDTSLRLDASNEDTGTDLDWEETFGKGDVNRFRFDGSWRIADRHKLRGMWFDFSRKRTRNSDFEIEWGDEVFPAETELTAKNRFTITELAYEYSWLRREDLELAATIGVHYTQFRAELEGTVSTGGGSETREASDTARMEVPLPVLGLRGLWRAGGDFWVDASVQYFSLTYDVYHGRIIDTRLALLWQPRDWAGVGLGYNRFEVDFSMSDDEFSGELEWVYDGPQIFYSVAF